MRKLLLIGSMILCTLGLGLPALAQDVDLYEYEDGSVTAVDDEGNAAHVDADGNATTVDDEGNVLYEDVDGSATLVDTDGNVAHEDTDGNTTILVDP
ncbi:MAG: hypothetical protein HY785_22990 [Oscillatoriophycideae cyanobacterium NC_groundwater_1537_Pr4_S-0.65um_50_18]|nr:hypothetical protein [Oscillatoriophycideae cyanobacterium NC_groundwater_1537_Pr4_S-0.65um_50_18]